MIIKDFIYRIRGEYSTDRLIRMGLKVGKNLKRMHGVILDESHCWLITIGDNVTFAPNVHVLAHDASTKYHLGYTKIGSIKIGNNVFVGAESVILPGVEIGDNVIIGANSVVTRSLDSDNVYGGNPAVRICSLTEYLDKQTKLMNETAVFDESYTIAGGITDEKKKEMINKLKNGRGFVV